MGLKQRLTRLESTVQPTRRFVVVEVNQGRWSENGQTHDGELPDDLQESDILVRFFHNIGEGKL